MARATFTVDLGDPATLADADDRYLRHGVCPVGSPAFPGLFVEVDLDVRLPGGVRVLRSGQVIRRVDEGTFLVQPGEPIPVPRQSPAPAPEAGQAAAVTGGESGDSDLYARIHDLPLLEKQRLARQGNRTVRQLLARDPTKSLHVLVVANPQVTLDEATEYAAMPTLSKEALDCIAARPLWIASRKLLFALVRNPSVAPETATRLVGKLGPNELRVIARPGVVRPAIAAAARRLLVE